MIKRLGVCGSIGSGKSYVASVLARDLGYKHVSADFVFKHFVLPDPTYRTALTEHLKHAGIEPFQADGTYKASEVGAYLFAAEQGLDLPRLRAVNHMNAPHVLEALREHVTDKCVIEMAVLPDYRYLDELDLDLIVRVHAGGDTAVVRDAHRVPAVTRRIKAYQDRRLDSAQVIDAVIGTKHSDGSWLTDAEILEAFGKLLETGL